jgi:hypothetical protein
MASGATINESVQPICIGYERLTKTTTSENKKDEPVFLKLGKNQTSFCFLFEMVPSTIKKIRIVNFGSAFVKVLACRNQVAKSFLEKNEDQPQLSSAEPPFNLGDWDVIVPKTQTISLHNLRNKIKWDQSFDLNIQNRFATQPFDLVCVQCFLFEDLYADTLGLTSVRFL